MEGIGVANRHNLAVQGTYREIFQRTLPILLSSFIPQINGMINTIFLGRLDAFYLAVGGISSIYYLIFVVLGIGFNNGVQILIAKYAGRNNHEAIRKVFYNACFWAMVLSLFFLAFSLLGARWLFSFFIGDKRIAGEAANFIQVRIWGVPFLYLYLLRNALYVNYNQTKTLILFSLAEAVTNIVLDYALIFGNLGLPRIGFIGAAYASVIAEIVGFLLVIGQLKYYPLHSRQPIQYAIKYHARYTKDMFSIVLPVTLQMGLSLFSWQFFFFLIATRGIAFLAASNILRSIFTILHILVWAIGNTTNSIASNLYGQGRIGDIGVFLSRIIRFALLSTLVMSAIFGLGQHFILSFFSKDPEVLRLLPQPYFIILITLCCNAFTNPLFNTLLSVKKGMFIVWIEIICIVVYGLYAYGMIAYWRLSLPWIWSSEVVYAVVLALLASFPLYRLLRKYARA